MENLIEEKILSGLNDKQKSIVEDYDENLYVTACPGSGKTRTLTRKIAYNYNLYPNSSKKIIAITYTSRAANEIQERLETLGIESGSVWVGTIHQFCLSFIIRPFGNSSKRVSKGFKIIDEYVSENYLRDCCKQLGIKYEPYNLPNIRLDKNGELLEIDPAKKKIARLYHKILVDNREIDFDLILKLSFSILEKTPINGLILAKTIRSIFVDEFQDTSECQYDILGKISNANPSIKFLFVGDTDQAIYTSLGGVAKTKQELEALMNLTFFQKQLDGCYRSSQKIINCYSRYQQNSMPITSFAAWKSEQGTIYYSNKTHKNSLPDEIARIIDAELAKGIREEEICIASPRYDILAPLITDLKLRLPGINFRSQDIHPIKPDDLNIFYKISFIAFTEIGKRVWPRKRISSEVIELFETEYGILIKDMGVIDLLDLINSFSSTKVNALDLLEELIETLLDKLGISRKIHPKVYEDLQDFLEKARERVRKNNLGTSIGSFKNAYETKKGINASTIHKIKGEEYHTVIGIGLLKGYIPNWNNVINDQDHGKKEANKTLYVLMSRAKHNLFLFSETGRTTAKGNPYIPTEFL